MAVDERARKRLHDALERAIGRREAATLMEQLSRLSEMDTVTIETLRRELSALEARLGIRIIRWVVAMTFTSIVVVSGLVLSAFSLGSS